TTRSPEGSPEPSRRQICSTTAPCWKMFWPVGSYDQNQISSMPSFILPDTDASHESTKTKQWRYSNTVRSLRIATIWLPMFHRKCRNEPRSQWLWPQNQNCCCSTNLPAAYPKKRRQTLPT